MSEPSDPTQQPKPERLLHQFSRTRLDGWLAVALIIHVALLGATSVPYIWDTWIDPTGAAERRAATTSSEEDEQETVRQAIEESSPTATTPSPTEARESREDVETAPEPPESPVEQRVRDAASPEEIPRDPDDLGISLEETNR